MFSSPKYRIEIGNTPEIMAWPRNDLSNYSMRGKRYTNVRARNTMSWVQGRELENCDGDEYGKEGAIRIALRIM
ncbi:hypothetical protein SBOR_7926 [Sclerotinia borealis F-4128]|uniref:Uncharacterized protein n=1 Tax=Sclerotinia borealis (strain F-4128) TaxID=1432307 RepID=W9C9X5_SCLBF|nr:hypothetical protein SBOR_7926 [Sclerotinia borealis F-4128]